MSQEVITRRQEPTNGTFNLRHEAAARQFFRAVFADEREAQQTTAEFMRLSRAWSGAAPPGAPAAPALEQFYQRLAQDTAAGPASSREAQAGAVRATLDEMRAQSLAVRSSPQARRAHLEIDAQRPADDLRLLLETPEGRTRAEHAHYLHEVHPEARDLYERGAVVAGEAVIIPRDANSAPDSAGQVRLGSLAHAVQTFTPLVGTEQARVQAAEFVTLGRDIAGRTADGDTRLVVFREFYRQVQRDEQGRLLPPAEQTARLDVVMEQMRPLAAALRAQEWTREDAEIVPLDEWERGRETRQRDAEHEAAGRLTYRLGETPEPDLEAHRAAPERDAPAAQLEELLHTHGTASVSYERLSFARQPPHLPENLTPAETRRLRYEVVPYLDQQLENGVPTAVLLSQLARRQAQEERTEHAAQVTRLFRERHPAAHSEQALTRAEEAQAGYTLRALGLPGSAEFIRQSGFSAQERAAALDTVGGRLAQDYRAQVGQLKAFAALEEERQKLAHAATVYAAQQRATPEFQARRTEVRRHEQSAGPQPALRQALAALLVNPETARAQTANTQHISQAARTLSQQAGTEITNSAEARAALAPALRRQRAVLDEWAAERATLPMPRTTRPGARQPNPLYVASPAQPNLRLAVASPNEYRLVSATTAQAGVNLHTYAGLHGPPLTVESPARAAELNFARDYLSYRLSDETTRLRNSNRLFREFDARLTQARTPDELRHTVKDIRQENYARAHDPERFAAQDAEARAYGLPPLRPLNGTQIKQLFLAEAPAHYNDEMRQIRRDASLTARDKQERVKSLAQGQVPPSPALQTLLEEFGRTQARHPAQTTRNIKAFLSDYLNPPTETRARFSRHNLNQLRQQLAPAERDYLYQVIEQARQATLTTPVPQREAHNVPERAGASRVASARAAPDTPAQARPTEPTPPASLRTLLAERISSYLVEVVNTRGATALAAHREGGPHATQVSRLVKETFREQGIAPAAYRLTDERIAAVAGQLVGALPHALQQEYAKHLGAHRQEPARPERSAGLAGTRPQPGVLPAVRIATQAALEPLLENSQTETKDRSDLPGPAPAWAQPPAPTSRPRPQEIAAQSRSPPNDRFVWRR